MTKQDHHLFLSWLILSGVIAFFVVVTWHQGLFHTLFSSDKSRISIAICLIYLIGSLHCAIRAWKISRQLLLGRQTETLIHAQEDKVLGIENSQLLLASKSELPAGLMSDFLLDMVMANESKDTEHNNSSTLAEIYSDKLKGSHDYGWFFVDAMIKLGLLGTIVGFILMLGSIADSSTLDINAMQKVLQQMSSGMGTALYTTLAGLVCSLLLAIQYQMLDRGADDLMHKAVHLAEVHVLPNLKPTSSNF